MFDIDSPRSFNRDDVEPPRSKDIPVPRNYLKHVHFINKRCDIITEIKKMLNIRHYTYLSITPLKSTGYTHSYSQCRDKHVTNNIQIHSIFSTHLRIIDICYLTYISQYQVTLCQASQSNWVMVQHNPFCWLQLIWSSSRNRMRAMRAYEHERI